MGRTSDLLIASDTISRVGNILVVGEATKMTDASDGSATWLPDNPAGAYYLVTNAVICGMSDGGGKQIGVSGLSSTALGDAATIGVAGGIINESGIGGVAAWAFYADVQHESGARSYGIEVACKDKSGINSFGTPYNLSGGTFGVWCAGGSDSTYGGLATNPSNSAVCVLSNSHTWNNGILFEDGGITGDSVEGGGIAISMGRGHIIKWQNSTGAAASIGISGSGADVDLVLTPGGAGFVKFGTFTSNADAAVNGYVRIRDAGGTIRKLATIA